VQHKEVFCFEDRIDQQRNQRSPVKS